VKKDLDEYRRIYGNISFWEHDPPSVNWGHMWKKNFWKIFEKLDFLFYY
jgi:hypothetical protein